MNNVYLSYFYYIFVFSNITSLDDRCHTFVCERKDTRMLHIIQGIIQPLQHAVVFLFLSSACIPLGWPNGSVLGENKNL